jgi:hypothetical protein
MAAYIGFQAYSNYRPVQLPIPDKYIKHLPKAFWLPVAVYVVATISLIISASGTDNWVEREMHYANLFFGTLVLFPHCFTAAGVRNWFKDKAQPSKLLGAAAVLLLIVGAGFFVISVVGSVIEGDDPILTYFVGCAISLLLSGGLNLSVNICLKKIEKLDLHLRGLLRTEEKRNVTV